MSSRRPRLPCARCSVWRCSRSARRRVRNIADEFGRSATKAARDEELTKKQASNLTSCKTEERRLSDKIREDNQKKSDLEDRLERAQGDLERLVGSIAAHEELQRRLADNRERRTAESRSIARAGWRSCRGN